MGNQQSHQSPQSLNSAYNVHPLEQQWAPDNVFCREYPMPDVTSPVSDGHIKVRKQSSPAPLTNIKSRSRFKPLLVFRKDSIGSSTLSKRTAIQPTSTLPPNAKLANVSQTSMNPLAPPLAAQRRESIRMLSTDRRLSVGGPGYLLPNDEEEIDRLHVLHFMVRFAIQGNYLAPVSDMLRNGGRVLDIGCGPGSWTMEIAGEYPKSQVVGVDVSSMFPREIKPANCTFHQCDIRERLPFENESFDYIFMRFMGLVIKDSQWPILLAELMRLLKPGGWIELVESDTEIYRTGPVMREYNQMLINAMKDYGLDPCAGRRLKERLQEQQQLTNINESFISCPGGQWAGKLGHLTLQSWQAFYHALGPQLCRHTNRSVEEYIERLASCWREADEYKTFENVHFAYAQKSIDA